MNFGYVFKTTGGRDVTVSEPFKFEDSKPFIPHYSVVKDETFDAIAAGCAEGTKCYNIHPPYAGVDSENHAILVPADMDVIEHPDMFEVARYNYNIDQAKRSDVIYNGRDDDEEGCFAFFGIDMTLVGNNPTEVFGPNTYLVRLMDLPTTEPLNPEFRHLVLRVGEERLERTTELVKTTVEDLAWKLNIEYTGDMDYDDFKLQQRHVAIVALMLLRQNNIITSRELDAEDVLYLYILENIFREDFIKTEHLVQFGYIPMLIGAAIGLICAGIIVK